MGVLGAEERNLKLLREALGVRIVARDGVVKLSGEDRPVVAAQRVLDRLVALAANGRAAARTQVLDLIADELASGTDTTPESRGIHGWDGHLDVYASGRPLRARTPNQQIYIEAIRDHDLVIAAGPAGTGKTYLAVAAAVHLLKTGRIGKLILARPAVEAGEKLGFLPGGLEEKVNPFLRPLFDALNDMMDYATIRRFMDSDVIEVVPLAYMRGRTLNKAVIICDEAQNTTRGQMQMFLTRMGHGSKMIVTGDVTQIDLPDPTQSGLIDAIRRLQRVKGVATVALQGSDVVRHQLVQRIIQAYGEDPRAADTTRQLNELLARADEKLGPAVETDEPTPAHTGPEAEKDLDGQR
jgi:phosphate starvation-inducible protein PhoH and related proteins